jgi:hypothetical protein
MHGKTKEFLVLLKNSREVHIYVYSKKERAKNPLVDLGYSKKRPSKLFKNFNNSKTKGQKLLQSSNPQKKPSGINKSRAAARPWTYRISRNGQ